MNGIPSQNDEMLKMQKLITLLCKISISPLKIKHIVVIVNKIDAI